MKQIILLSIIFFIFPSINKVEAQVFWKEEFSIPDKGYWIDDTGNLVSDFTTVGWTVDVSAAHFAAAGDYARTVSTSGGRFETLDSDGDIIWYSPELNISNYSSVSLSVLTNETGSSSVNEKKYVKARYRLDGINHSFQNDSVASGNWGEKMLTSQGIKGDLLQLMIVMNSSYANDKVIIDNVIAEGIDSSLFTPQQIVLTQLPSFIFQKEEANISATVLDKRGEVITNKLFDLQLLSSQLEVVDEGFDQGVYTWIVTSDSTGKAFFTLEPEGSTLAGIDSSLVVYDRKELILEEDFEDGMAADWQLNGEWEISAESPISGNYSLKHLVQPVNGLSLAYIEDFNRSLNDGAYRFSFTLKNSNWDPSSSNLFYVEIVDSDSLPTGYVVGVNAKGSSDLVSLWSIKMGSITGIVAETALEWNEDGLAQIELSGDGLGNWALTAIDRNTGIAYPASGFNDDYGKMARIGLVFNYTQTRSGQLWFDDLMVLRKNTPPAIREVESLPDGKIMVCFTEAINTGKLSKDNFSLTGESGVVYEIGAIEMVSGDTLYITPEKISEPDLSLSINAIEDLEGATASGLSYAFNYQFPLSPLDVVINEVLFNPKSGGSDFVELYNRSGFGFDISNLYLATRNDTMGLQSVYQLSASQIYFPGQTYLVFTKDSFDLATNYRALNPEAIIQMEHLPSYPDDEGRVVLLNDLLEVIDEFAYSKEMHSPWLSDDEGVSLERLSFEGGTNDADNWHSASSLAGYATPGYENSQQEEDTTTVSVTINPDAISPNGDGFHDQMEICFHLDKPGYLANVYVYNVQGQRVCYLLNNGLMGTESKITFNGVSGNGALLPMGIYILFAEVVHNDGDRKVFKKAFLVTDIR